MTWLIVLGFAISSSIDNLGVGISYGIRGIRIGLSPFAISVAASVGSFVTIREGVVLGDKMAAIRIGSFTIGQFGTILSGVILLFIAIRALF